MKKRFKKGLSVLVGVLMLISMMPTGVMAEEATAVNGAAVNQSDENVDSQGGSALTPMPNSLTMPSANDPMVNVIESIPGEPVTAESGIDPAPQAVPQNLETTEAIQTSAIEGDFEYEAVAGGVSITRYTGPGGNVVIPSTLAGKKVVAIGYLSFYDCFSLTNITIPDSVTRIGSSAFRACSSLTNITIPDSVTTIGSYAFQDCPSLTTITIPDGVTTIGSSAFYRCSSLTSINVNSNNLNYSSLDGVLFDKAVTTLILCPGGKVSITIPNSVTSIGDFAFSGSASLTSITIPDRVTTIGGSAFSGCSSLTNVTIPNSITRIGDSAFWGCSSLTNVTIPDSVTSIGAGAFYRCSSLISIQINSANTTIYDSADGRPDGWTIPVSAAIIGHNPSTAKDFAVSYNRTFIEIGADKRLKEIAITSPAQKLVYQVGEALDLTGLTVIGTYSDGTTQQMALTSDNILGFASSYPESSQVLTIAIEGITTTYTVQIIEANEPGQSGLTAFLLKDVYGNLYEYDQDSIHLSYVSFQTNPNLPNAKMYQHFSGILTSGGKVYGLKDGSKGYMDYEAAVTAYMIAQFSEQPFDMNAYLALDSSKKLIEPLQNIQVVDKDGNVTY